MINPREDLAYGIAACILWTALFLIVLFLTGCGGGGGGDKARGLETSACAAMMDSVYPPGLHPHSDWSTARANAGVADPAETDLYREMWFTDWELAWRIRDACYAETGYIPAWKASRATIARRLAEMGG